MSVCTYVHTKTVALERWPVETVTPQVFPSATDPVPKHVPVVGPATAPTAGVDQLGTKILDFRAFLMQHPLSKDKDNLNKFTQIFSAHMRKQMGLLKVIPKDLKDIPPELKTIARAYIKASGAKIVYPYGNDGGNSNANDPDHI